MSINLTDEIEVKTKKGKLGAAKQIFLEGDTQTVENEIQNINSRHNDLNSKHESLSSTVSEHTNQIESNQNQITANKSTQDAKNASLDANMAKLNTRDDQITELVRGITATGGASVATTVTYDNTSSHLASATVQGAIDELQGSKIDKTSILQELGNAEDKVMSQKSVSDELSVMDGKVDELESQVIYDVTANNDGVTFDSLSALLSDENLSTLIPTSVRHGGMSIRFIQGSDNKYVQYRLMNQNWSTIVTDWQGVDNELVYQSRNIITGGAVGDAVLDIKDVIGKEETFTYDSKQYANMILVNAEGYPKTPTTGYDGIIIPIVAGEKYVITTPTYSASTFSSYPIKEDSSNVVRTNLRGNVLFIAGETEKYLLVSLRLSDSSIVSITRKETGVYKRLSDDELRLNNNETSTDEINGRLGYSAETLNLTSSDAANMYWNGDRFLSQEGDAHNCLVVKCNKGAIYSSTSNRLSFYIFDYEPYVGSTRQPLTYKNSIIMPYTAEYNGYMVFQFATRESISLNLTLTNSGVFELIQSTISQNAVNSEKIVQLNNDVNNINIKIGENSQILSFPADVKDMFWNGTYFSPNTGSNGTKALVFKCTKGVPFTWNPSRRLSIYIFDYEPYVGATTQPIVLENQKLPSYTPAMDGWVVIQGDITKLSFELSIDSYGLIKDTEELNSDLVLAKSITRLQEYSLGNRLINQAKTFSWKSFNNPIISIRADDLNVEIDLIVKIVTDADLPIMLAAPPNLNSIPTGITNQEDRIGETMGEICQYVVAHGGEILEHSYATFTSSDYETSIKPFFIDSKAAFMELGINIRGAAVANSNPSDSLRDNLAPYLYYYYDFSNGYGKNAPYNMGTWESTNDGSIYTFEAFKQKVDSTIAQNKHWTFVLHHIGGSSNISEETFRQMVNYVKEKKEQGIIDVLTWSNVYDTYGQFT